jgi:hypothetical protein
MVGVIFDHSSFSSSYFSDLLRICISSVEGRFEGADRKNEGMILNERIAHIQAFPSNLV